jgi:hypothetical protein
MKKSALLALVLVRLVFGFSLQSHAQSYAIDWYKVAGGGGTSTNGLYSLSGTIGQPDASGVMSGGNFSVTGGYWALINVVQTPGAPPLYISHSGNVVTVYWQNLGSWTLQQNGNLAVPVGWNNSSGINLIGGTNYLALTNPAGTQFFRLK